MYVWLVVRLIKNDDGRKQFTLAARAKDLGQRLAFE
jgi:hypothetical protein